MISLTTTTTKKKKNSWITNFDCWKIDLALSYFLLRLIVLDSNEGFGGPTSNELSRQKEASVWVGGNHLRKLVLWPDRCPALGPFKPLVQLPRIR